MRIIFFVFIFILTVFSASTQEEYEIEIINDYEDWQELEQEERKAGIWISPSAELAMYSISAASYGAGLSLAYGKGSSMGIKTVYFFDIEQQLNVLEIGVLFNIYFKGKSYVSGPFLNLSAGQAVFFRQGESASIPAQWGVIYAGIGLGWRFLLGETIFIEPIIRAGYPYLLGTGLAFGLLF